MPCKEEWRTSEAFDSQDNLVVTVTVPNNCYYLDTVGYTLPPGADTSKLCNYNSNDVVLILEFRVETSCNPTSTNVDIPVVTNYKKEANGHNVQIVVNERTNDDKKKPKVRKRTSVVLVGLPT